MKLIERMRTAAQCLPPSLVQKKPYEVPLLRDEQVVMPEPALNYKGHVQKPAYNRQTNK
jgi:hypothetical protein